MRDLARKPSPIWDAFRKAFSAPARALQKAAVWPYASPNEAIEQGLLGMSDRDVALSSLLPGFAQGLKGVTPLMKTAMGFLAGGNEVPDTPGGGYERLLDDLFEKEQAENLFGEHYGFSRKESNDAIKLFRLEKEVMKRPEGKNVRIIQPLRHYIHPVIDESGADDIGKNLIERAFLGDWMEEINLKHLRKAVPGDILKRPAWWRN